MTRDDRAKEAAKTVSRFVNSAYSDDIKTFIDTMGRDHRTLQQNFTRLCAAWLEHQATVERFDMRNEASVALGKEFVTNVSENIRVLPFI